MSNIQYKPNLEYKKNYDTQGVINSNNDYDNTPSESPSENTVGDLSEKLTNIENTIQGLPTDIYDAVKTPIAGVRYMLDNIGDDAASPAVETIIKQTVPNDSIIIKIDDGTETSYVEPLDDLEDIPDEVFPNNDSININVEIVKIPQTEIIDKEYKFDMVCIFVDYIDKLTKNLADFYSSMIAIADEANLHSFVNLYANFTGNSKDISDNLKPMSDFVIRNQISLDQQLRMYKKIFDIDSMIVNIRACKSAAELRKRYYVSNYVEDSSLLSMVQNDLLANTRMDFDKKYTENLYNLYKYLNSSVILISECMKMYIKTSQAKAALIKNEGVSLQW